MALIAGAACRDDGSIPELLAQDALVEAVAGVEQHRDGDLVVHR